MSGNIPLVSNPCPGSSVQDQINALISQINSSFAGLNPASVDITGGTIDGTTIGGSVPAPGTFSTLKVGTDTVATLLAIQTLVNKTFTAPAINNGTISGSIINNATIGLTTAAAAAFTTVQITGLNSAGVVTTDASGNLATNLRLPAAQFPALTGDVTTTAGSLATTIAAHAVTAGKMATGTADTVAGYDVSGNFSGITIGAGLALSGSVLSATGGGGGGSVTTSGSPASGNITIFSGATAITNGDLTGDVTTSGTAATTIAAGAVTTSKIANNAITNALIRQGVARSVVGVTGNATANVADIQGAANQALLVNSAGTALAFTAVPNAALATMASNTIKGNVTGGSAVPTDVTATQLTALINAFSSSLSGATPASGGGTTKFLRADGSWSSAVGGGAVSVMGARAWFYMQWSSNSRFAIGELINGCVMYNGSTYVNPSDSAVITVDITTSGLGGIDTGTVAANTWYYVWEVSDGTNRSAYISLSYNSPTIIGAYAWVARVGVVRTDGSANLVGFVQYGNEWWYQVGSNLSGYPLMASSANTGNLTTPTWSGIDTTNFVPNFAHAFTPIASSISVLLITQVDGKAMLAPDSSYGAYASISNPPPLKSQSLATGDIESFSADIGITNSALLVWAAASTLGNISYVFCKGFKLVL